MTKDEALRMALQALEKMESYEAMDAAITAIKEALIEPEEQFCYCDDSISLQIVSGGAAVGGLYSRVTLKIDGEYVDYVKERPEQEHEAWHDKIIGVEVSMDVSTGEDDAYHRVFGRVYEVMLEKCGALNDIILAIEDARNFTTSPKRELKSTTDMMMELADRLGELPDDVDPRAWEHLLVYAPKSHPLTDEQIDAAVKAWFESGIISGDQPFAKRMRAAIEAAHGIKELNHD